MIHEILKILDTTDLQEIEKQRITTDLLWLCNVVGRSEQLKAFADWRDENEDWINNNCKDNNDVIKAYRQSL